MLPTALLFTTRGCGEHKFTRHAETSVKIHLTGKSSLFLFILLEGQNRVSTDSKSSGVVLIGNSELSHSDEERGCHLSVLEPESIPTKISNECGSDGRSRTGC